MRGAIGVPPLARHYGGHRITLEVQATMPSRCHRTRKVLVVLAAATLMAAPARAQTPQPPSVDFTVGLATSWGGTYSDRATPSFSLTFVPDHRGVGILAFTAGVRPQVTADALICRLQPDGSCLSQPQFPGTTQVGIAGGVEAAGAGGSVRATLGPMLYVGGLRAYGARLQVDAAGGFRHVQLVVGGRGDLVRHGGETLRLGAVELGLRLLD